MKLSDQALGALMMALQKSLLEQSDITFMLKEFEFDSQNEELFVLNPPVVRLANVEEEEEIIMPKEEDW
jgi:hypothetical protein